MQDLKGYDVSRETLDRLEHYGSQLKKWNSSINLVSKATIPDLWTRHILDSAQVHFAAERGDQWLDIGSGGGLPGLVVAILAQEFHPDRTVTLMESDTRKSVFLRTIIRELSLDAQVLTHRIESAPPQGADILSARALADLTTLLSFAQRHLSPEGHAVFQKGENWRNELAQAREEWQFDAEVLTSVTESQAVLLKIRNIARA